MDTMFTENQAEEEGWPCRMCDHENSKPGSIRAEENCQFPCSALGSRIVGDKPSKFELRKIYLIPQSSRGGPGFTWEQTRDCFDENNWKAPYSRLLNWSKALVSVIKSHHDQIKEAIDPEYPLLEDCPSRVAQVMLVYRGVTKKFEEVKGAIADTWKALGGREEKLLTENEELMVDLGNLQEGFDHLLHRVKAFQAGTSNQFSPQFIASVEKLLSKHKEFFPDFNELMYTIEKEKAARMDKYFDIMGIYSRVEDNKRK